MRQILRLKQQINSNFVSNRRRGSFGPEILTADVVQFGFRRLAAIADGKSCCARSASPKRINPVAEETVAGIKNVTYPVVS